ncbi:hypothetical protein MCUN1_002788 [Malassezia cuniculi]|uniref:Uncharacterized protein n=1 Tax=Malassezia cuniculi TaxID=948313 RepID=A0AAF0F0C6_9BASI|nr:hypothetical protein MCUN1_002788 [Malassezia cuniculi]
MAAPILYKFPSESYQTILLLAFFLWVDNAKVGSIGAKIRNAVGGYRVLDVIRTLVLAIHVAEAAGIAFIALKRGATLSVTVSCIANQLKWALTTFVVGFPSLLTFKDVNHGFL